MASCSLDHASQISRQVAGWRMSALGVADSTGRRNTLVSWEGEGVLRRPIEITVELRHTWARGTPRQRVRIAPESRPRTERLGCPRNPEDERWQSEPGSIMAQVPAAAS